MTLTAAAASAASPTASLSQRFTAAFAPDPARVPDLRRLTSEHLCRWKVFGAVAEDIVLAVSELVTNAVQHGHGEGTLTVRYDAGALHIEVADHNRAPATVRMAREDDVSGRGLLLVDALAEKWGVSNEGTTTWCRFVIRTTTPPLSVALPAKPVLAAVRRSGRDPAWD
ncbi:ATP-binding protein [Streptomyces crystallinus]|uniref:Histidine kinase/HSP90-like ATPase domain-containing protein n=1 Tax=Streptomyces crystallinus TaxID=68191 RepID=A0ABN1GIG5_9ACTN